MTRESIKAQTCPALQPVLNGGQVILVYTYLHATCFPMGKCGQCGSGTVRESGGS